VNKPWRPQAGNLCPPNPLFSLRHCIVFDRGPRNLGDKTAPLQCIMKPVAQLKTSMGQLWPDKIVTPEKVIEKSKPGMSTFIGTGVAEPGTMDRTLINSTAGNLADLELIQLVSFGDVISLGKLLSQQFRIPFYDERI